MTILNEIAIRPYEAKDFSALCLLVGQNFGPRYILTDQRFLAWQYSGSGVLYLAMRGREVIGFFGGKDLTYKIYDTTATVRTVMNLFVGERYRMAGVGPLLGQAVFDPARYVLVSGYNDPARQLYRHLRAGWQEWGIFSRFLAIMASRHPVFGARKAPSSAAVPVFAKQESAYKIVECVLQDESSQRDLIVQMAALWERIRVKYPVSVERTPDYLLWRFCRHPFLVYRVVVAYAGEKIAGFLIYRIEAADDFSIARIIDLVAEDPAEAPLIAACIKNAESSGAHAADFMFSGLLYRDSLRRCGFFDTLGTDFEQFPIYFNPMSSNKFVINVASDIPAAWGDVYMTKADGDQDRPNPH